MNRNVESHFATLPRANIERSVLDRSRNVKTSLNAGDLIPFLVEEVLPGDTFDITTSKVVRSQTMLTPLFGDLFLDTYYFFVPARLCWEHFREFCGENTESAWAPTVEYSMPTIAAPVGGFETGTIADYMGLPVGVQWKATDELAPMALPFRALALICNEFFRDQNLTDPLLIPLDDANQQGTNGGNYITDVANGGKPFRVAKYHSYESSCLPAPQKGDPVGIPINVPLFSGGIFPVTTVNQFSVPDSGYPVVYGWDSSTGPYNQSQLDPVTPDQQAAVYRVSNAMTSVPNNNSITGNFGFPVNLAVDIPAQEAGEGGVAAASFDVNELRLAFAYQRFLEQLARSGSRYQEILAGLYGVSSPDARLQRPEYLGGNRVPIHVTEVTNTAQTDSDFLGDVAAKSQTNDRNRDVVKSFTEFGYLIGCMCIRYEHSYSQGIEKFWTRKKFTDFYNPKFAHLGEMPVYQAELCATAENMATRDQIFGYNEAWSEYRFGRNLVTAEMRPGVPNSLSYWNLSDYYEEPPFLSDEWIRETPDNLDRVLAVSHDVANQFWADIYIHNKCTRPMPVYSVPGLIDHF